MSTADLKSKLVELRREIDRELRCGYLVREDAALYSVVGSTVDHLVEDINRRAAQIQEQEECQPAF